jgi:hypothetical protein
MNTKTYGTLFEEAFDKALENAIWENYRTIQLPSTSTIEASWNAVLQRLEERNCIVNEIA